MIEELSRIDIDCVENYANANMRARTAAKKMHYDRRTISYHFDRVQKATGLDPRNFHDLCRLVQKINEWKGEM